MGLPSWAIYGVSNGYFRRQGKGNMRSVKKRGFGPLIPSDVWDGHVTGGHPTTTMQQEAKIQVWKISVM